MKYSTYPVYWLLLLALSPSVSAAGVYIAISPGLVTIDTPVESTRPSVADVRLGYAASKHLFELSIMSSLNDDSLNQLTVDIPSARAAFYRYSPYDEGSSLKLHLIVGVSQIDVDSSYPGTPDTTDRFEGGSFGIGLEESFKSIPDLKIRFEWIQLYRGDDINIDAMTLGLRYDF